MRVLLAFDKFKDALTASEACACAAGALAARHPDWTLDLCPLADGGDGFCEILTRAAGGELHAVSVTGPRGAPVFASYGIVPAAAVPVAARTWLDLPEAVWTTPEAKIALVEMAAASGLALLAPAERDPWLTTAFGTGELVRAAAAVPGVAALVLGLGGSATHDLGLGLLAALGSVFLDAGGGQVQAPVPAEWGRIVRAIGLPAPFSPPGLRLACDVANPLLGPQGAVAVYAPQKGLRPESAARLEAESARLAVLLAEAAGGPAALAETPGAGAAGGTAFGALCGAGARLCAGAGLVGAWLDLDARLARADLVITGEGRFDAGSLAGKGPGALVRCALAVAKPVHVFAGAVELAEPSPGLRLHALSPPDLPLAQALRETAARLKAAVDACDFSK